MKTAVCPLCQASKIAFSFKKASGESYLKCSCCSLIFLEPRFYLSLDLEKAQYDLHENDVHDIRYQSFMEPLVTELLKRTPGRLGLDFGCGPTSVLVHLLKFKDYELSLYDKFYFPDHLALQKKYDFIFASEVVEHFQEPGKELNLLFSLLNEKGILIMGTSLYDEVSDFSKWSYTMDPTHVAFYSKNTFKWLATHLGFDPPVFFSNRGILLTKK